MSATFRSELTETCHRGIRLRYSDNSVFRWFYAKAPCRWHGRVTLHFEDVPFGTLLPAGSWTHPDGVANWLWRMQAGRAIPPPVVCRTRLGGFYLFDGNHRYEALQEYLGEAAGDASIRVAVLMAKQGYEFQYRYFDTYGTYVLVPSHGAAFTRKLWPEQEPANPVRGIYDSRNLPLRAAAASAGASR